MHHGLAEGYKELLEWFALLLQLSDGHAQDDTEHHQAQDVCAFGPFGSDLPISGFGYAGHGNGEKESELFYLHMVECS